LTVLTTPPDIVNSRAQPESASLQFLIVAHR
jgi:hypothetical protein